MRSGPTRARRWPAFAFLVVSFLLMLTVWQSSLHLPPGEAGLGTRATPKNGDQVLGPWLWWDAGVYESIADHGYPLSDVETFQDGGEARVAFFPGYPIVVRGVGSPLGDTALALILVTFTAGLLFTLMFARWTRSQTGEGVARWALGAVLLFPWGYFLVATGYSDALYLLCAVTAFALLEDDHPIAAGGVGALASLTRPVGIAVVIGLAVRMAERRGALRFEGRRPRFDRTRLRPADHGVLLAASGIGAFAAFCWARYGDPFAFATALRAWNDGSGPRAWFKVPLIEMIANSPDTWFVLRLVAQGVVILVFCAAIPAVWRRFGSGYGAYSAVVLLMPAIGSAAFASDGRHAMAAFPVFALLGEHLQRWSRARAIAYLGVSGLLLLAVTSFWARGYWMG